MSDNSYIYLTWIKDRYEVSHRNADDPNIEFGKPKKFKDLRKALIKTRNLQHELWPEYGITIGNLEGEL